MLEDGAADGGEPAPAVARSAEQGLGRLKQALAVAADLPAVTETLAHACVWMGLVGWALILYQEDGTHLFPCSVAGLGRLWQPPLRPLATTESWPVTRAALGQECTGCDRTGPYPLPPGGEAAAWSALPLSEGQGVLVALRPGTMPFNEAEQEFLRHAAQLTTRYVPHMISTAAAPAPTPHLRDLHQGAFFLDLATDTLDVDEMFARLHDLPGPGRYPLTRVLAQLPPGDLTDIQQLLGTLRSRHGTYEVAYRLATPADRPRHLQARCTTTGDPTAPPPCSAATSPIPPEKQSVPRNGRNTCVNSCAALTA